MAIHPDYSNTVASSIAERNRPQPFSTNQQNSSRSTGSDVSPFRQIAHESLPSDTPQQYASFDSSYDSFASDFNSAINEPSKEKSNSDSDNSSNLYFTIPDHYDTDYTYTPNPASTESPSNIEATQTYSGDPGSLQNLVDKHEGGGRYDTLFGHAQKSGPLAGTDITKMTIGQLGDFASRNGRYGQYQMSKIGYLATPMGRYQIVGSTLQKAAKELGLSPNTLFDKNTQDLLFKHLVEGRIGGDKSMSQKISGLRNEWEGFKHVSDADLIRGINNFQHQPSRPVQTATESVPVAQATPTPNIPAKPVQMASNEPFDGNYLKSYMPSAATAVNNSDFGLNKPESKPVEEAKPKDKPKTPNGFATVKTNNLAEENKTGGFLSDLNARSSSLGNKNISYFGDKNSRYVSQAAIDAIQNDYETNKSPSGFF